MKKMKTLHSLLSVFAFDNVIAPLVPHLFQGMDVVSRELTGYIPSVTRNAGAERAAKGQSVTYHIAPKANIRDIVPAMSIPEPTDQEIGDGQLVITKSRIAEFGWNGEEMKGLNTGPGALSVQADQFAQALRGLVNEVEQDIAREAELAASRMVGVAGTTPFATNHAATAQLRKVLDDNGAPKSERSLIIDTTAGANLRSLDNLTRVNEAGDSMMLRDGELSNLNGLSIKESDGIDTVEAGDAATKTTNDDGYAVGATAITLTGGTGTVLPGDVVTFAGDTNQYVVALVVGAVITLRAPGLRVAIGESNTAMTVVGTGVRNIGFTRSAIHLVTRAPALPNGRDAAIGSYMLTDPRSGLTFEVRIYEGFHKMMATVGIAWGTKAVKDEHIAGIFG